MRNISFDDDNEDNLAAIDFRIWLMIDGGWSESMWIYFVLLFGLNMPSIRFTVTSR